VVFGGKTFVSPDTLAPAGFVRMGEASLYKDHVYPLWNPYVFLGMPSFASGTYNPLIYPPDWPLALLQKVLPLPELTWMLIYYVLAGWSLYLLAREWGARAEGALLGAAAFVFAPNLIAVGSHGHGSQLVDSAYIPLMLWLATRWMRRGNFLELGFLALAGGFQMLRGHVQICFYTWIAIGLYTLIEWIAGLRDPVARGRLTARAVAVALAAALAFGLAGFYNLPLRDYASHSIRGGTTSDGGVGMEYATQWSLAPYELPEVVVPGWAGFGDATYWGTMPFTDYPNAYVGMVTVLLAVPAFLLGGVPRIFAIALALASLMVSFGKNFPLYGFLYDHLPLFDKFRVPVMIIVLFQVAAALGAAWGWSLVLERGTRGEADRRLDRVLIASAIALALLLVAGFFGQDLWRGAYVSAATSLRSKLGAPFSPEAAAAAYRGFVADLGRVSIIGLFTVGAAWLARRGKIAASWASGIVLVLLLIELWPVSGRLMTPVIGDKVQRNLELGRDDVIELLEKSGPAGTFRILPIQEYQSNRYAGFGIASVGGMHAAKPRLFQDWNEAQLTTNAAWLRLLNVRFLVLPQTLEPAPPWLRLVHSGSAFVYENQIALPRATLVHGYRVITPGKAILDTIRSGSIESADLTLLEEDPRLTLDPAPGGTATIVSYRVNDVSVDVDTPGAALLRLADLYYPDWTVTVDGRPARVIKADYLLRAVPVPAGKHRVVFRFESKAMKSGLLLSIGSLIAVLLLIGYGVFRSRRRAPATAPAMPLAEAQF
jgi:hypothetical protein